MEINTIKSFKIRQKTLSEFNILIVFSDFEDSKIFSENKERRGVGNIQI